MKFLYLLLLFSSYIFAQINIQYLNDVPETFVKKYYEKKHNYNPLHIGNVWQYSSGHLEMINKDTLINEVTYYKREFPNYILWDVFTLERNDTVSGASYLFDILDLDRVGDLNEELLLDSLNVTNFTEYFSYKHITEFKPYDPPPYVSLIKDSSWAIVIGDTVMTRFVEYHCCFTGEIVADKFGIIWSMTERDPYFLTGAIIDGKKYGKIVNVKDEISISFREEFSLSQNYPNPFNPSTTINYSIPINTEFHPQPQNVLLIVHDVLGKEKVVLVNELKVAGNYSVNFNAAHLSSGIYYYSIITNSKKITKPMVLLK